MALSLRRKQPTAAEARGGAYLTDGTRLFRVLPKTDEEDDAVVWLEDCAAPLAAPQRWSVGRVVRRLQLVRPESP